ncbi:MAG: hypothetical protein PHE68_01890 [Candidatus Peribacteraceae bacterium]|nr:hypothetical protein [Candidatus Peribacteraceae bacterium]MDD5075390.1 hypothetical protein [Candidatus Peribacteraceae bacterium]
MSTDSRPDPSSDRSRINPDDFATYLHVMESVTPVSIGELTTAHRVAKLLEDPEEYKKWEPLLQMEKPLMQRARNPQAFDANHPRAN